MVPNLAFNKVVLPGFEQSCSTMATQKLEEKVQQHDEDAESSKIGWAHRGHMSKPILCASIDLRPALICDSYARRILCAAAIWLCVCLFVCLFVCLLE
jgi:hypothetical protein